VARPIRVLELRSVRGTGGGPEKTILHGAALSDASQYAVTVCYIRDLRDTIFEIEKRAAALGVDYVEVRERHSFDFSIWPVLRRLVTDRAIDIVHSHDYKTNLYAWLLGRRAGIVPLATLHGYTGNSRREAFYYAADKRLVRRFPLLIAVSEDLRRELIRTGSDPARVVRILNGIDHRDFHRDDQLRGSARAALKLDDRQIVIGAVGRLEQQKRFDLLMDACACLKHRQPAVPFKLVIAGEGSLRQDLERHRTRVGLDTDCELLGLRSDVTTLHHAFDVFVQSSDYEGTPNAVLEAMALETPVVATDVGGTSELVRHGIDGLIVPPGHPEAVADAVEQLLSDSEGTSRMVESARRRVEGELSFAARMETVERIYDRLAPLARTAGTHP
jgi:glycosyltransferase involved in cell wall biosynthesis